MLPFLRKKSYVNVQGIQPIRFHELIQRVGQISEASLKKIRAALRFTFEL